MISIKRIGHQLIFMISLLAALALCLLGCTNSPQQTTGLKTSTKPPAQTTGTSTSTATQNSPTIPPTKEIWPVNMPPDMTGRISEMLEVIPDTQDTFHARVWFIDYAAWNSVFGISISDYKNSEGNPTIESENAYISDLILRPYDPRKSARPWWYPWLGSTPFIGGIGGMGSWLNSYVSQETLLKMPIREQNFGYGPLDIERSIVSNSLYKYLVDSYEAIKGNFDTTAIIHAIENYQLNDDYHCPIVSDSNGVIIYSWDKQVNVDRILEPPIFDESGCGRTLAIQSHDIFGSREPGMIDGMIEANFGKVNSLADNPRYQELANKLETMGNMSAVMSINPLKTDLWEGGVEDPRLKDLNEKFQEAASYAPLMGLYTTFAAGLSVDEKGMFVSLILLYESPDQAEQDIGVLKERLAAGTNSMNSPWAVEVDDSEVWSDGNALCAKLYGNVTSYWDCFVHQEPLLVREN
jgi:hypothetical protein